MTRWLTAFALAACTDPTTVLAPVIDGPTSNDEGAAATGLDFITVAIAHQGGDIDITAKTFSRGQLLEITGVPFGDDLVIHMTGRIGSSEVAYGRSCAFGVRADGRIPSPHLFFSREVKFASMSTRPIARASGSAIMYRDGSGLLIGGVAPETGDAVRQVERFDPNTGEYRALDDVRPRIGSVIATVGQGADARIAVIGGIDSSTGAGATFVELIEADRASTKQIESIDDAQMARIGLTATTLADGNVVVFGGKDPLPGGLASADGAEITVANGTPIIQASRAKLAHARYGHSATRLADDVGASVLIAGGLDDAGLPVAAAELFKPLSEGFSATFNRQMVVPRSRHQAVRLPDGSVLFIGGVDSAGAPIAKLELFSLDAGFVDVGQLPGNAGLVDATATVLPDGRVLLVGGRSTVDGPPLTNAFIGQLDPLDGTVDIVATDRLEAPRAGHQATLLCDGTVLISGGSPAQEVYERYNPPTVGRR